MVRNSAAVAFYLEARDQGCSDAEAKAFAIGQFKRAPPGWPLSSSTIARILAQRRPEPGKVRPWWPVVIGPASIGPGLIGHRAGFVVAYRYKEPAVSEAIPYIIKALLARGIPPRKLVATIRRERALPFSAGHLRRLVRAALKRPSIHLAV